MSGDSEMVERVARAMFDKILPDKTSRVETDGAVVFDDVFDLTDLASAAILAMREPTEAMLNAARDWSCRKYGKPIGDEAAQGCWRAMNHAALSQKQDGKEG